MNTVWQYFDKIYDDVKLSFQIENILMEDDGTYVLCDFGSATAKNLNPKTHGVQQIEDELKR